MLHLLFDDLVVHVIIATVSSVAPCKRVAQLRAVTQTCRMLHELAPRWLVVYAKCCVVASTLDVFRARLFPTGTTDIDVSVATIEVWRTVLTELMMVCTCATLFVS